MTREYVARHRVPLSMARKPYVVVRTSARHSAVQTVRDGA